MLRCWRGIEARDVEIGSSGCECARINAGQNRTDVANDIRDGRDVYGRVDDGTHRNTPPALSRASRTNEWKPEFQTGRGCARFIDLGKRRRVIASFSCRFRNRRHILAACLGTQILPSQRVRGNFAAGEAAKRSLGVGDAGQRAGRAARGSRGIAIIFQTMAAATGKVISATAEFAGGSTPRR